MLHGHGARAADISTSFTLANGLQVVVLPDHRLPMVTHAVFYRAGSADDPPGQTGIAHFLEHLMFKGTKRYPTGQYDLFVTRAGGANNAFTSNDKTYYYEQILKEGLPRVMDLDADRMAGLDFAPAEAEHELKVVLEERRSYQNDPESVLAEEAGRALYGAGAYAHPVLGEPAETGALTMSAALAFHARFYSPGNAILVVAGDVTPEVVRALAEATYGRLPSGPPTARRLWSSAAQGCPMGRVEERHERVARDKLTLYFLTPGANAMGERSAAALRLLGDILQDQALSPLWQDLVGRRGIASELAAGHELKLAAGEFSITAQAEVNVTALDLETALLQSLSELRRAGIKPEALTEAKRHWLTARQLEADDQLERVTRYGEQLAMGRTFAEIEGEPRAIEAVTLPEVNAALRDFLSDRCHVSALLEKAETPSGPVPRSKPAHSTAMVH